MDYANNPGRVLHAGHHCGCGLTALRQAVEMSDSQAGAEIELARISSRLLDHRYLPHLDQQGLAAAIARAAIEHGLVRNGQLIWATTQEYFKEHPFSPVIERSGVGIERGQTLGDILKGRQIIRNPVTAVALLRTLHVDWNHVEKVFETKPAPVLIEPLSLKSSHTSPGRWPPHHKKSMALHFDTHFKKYADQYQELRRQFPDYGHMQLMRRLSYVASEVLTEATLAEAGYDVPFVLKDGTRYQQLDEELSQHIIQRNAMLREARHPRRITKSELQRGFRRPRILARKGMTERLVLTGDAIRCCEESSAAWRTRTRSTSIHRTSTAQSQRHFGAASLLSPATDQSDVSGGVNEP
jgi:hypothetical protein